MQIKNVDNFNLQDCENFLKNNPDSELAGAVSARREKLMDEIFQSKKREEDARKKQIQSYKDGMKWVDMAQFNEKKRYKTYYVFRAILMSVFCICFFLYISIMYYCNTEHYIYEEYASDQASHVTGVEHFLLVNDFIDTDSYYSDGFSPHFGHYERNRNFEVINVLGIVVSFLLVLISKTIHSPLVGKIYNIQDGDKAQKYRAIQNRRGKMGLCKVGRFKIKKVLPFDYDDIFMIRDNGFICIKDGKYGIYNAENKKMMVPIIYDDIYAINFDTLDLIKNKQSYSFTHKGYRIVK